MKPKFALSLTVAIAICLGAVVPVNALPEGAKLFAAERDWPAGADASPAFSPDGRTVVYTHAEGPRRILMISHRKKGAWSKPEVAPFSGQWRDLEPAMAPDGAYLVFISNRPTKEGGAVLDGFWGAPLPAGGGNIWRVDRQGGGWGAPYRLSDVVNSNSSIYAPAVAADGSLYFNQPDPTTRRIRLYRAKATSTGFADPEPVALPDGGRGDYDCAIAPDESFIVFFSNSTIPGATALKIAFRQDRTWGPPRTVLSAVNGSEARLGIDHRTAYFSAPESAGHFSSDAKAVNRIFQMALPLGSLQKRGIAKGPLAE